MEKEVVVKISDSLLTPFGLGTDTCYRALRDGRSCLQVYEGKWGLPSPFVAGFIDNNLIEEAWGHLPHSSTNYTRFEKMAILSIGQALMRTSIDASSRDTIFILGTTKGNIHLLSSSNEAQPELYLPYTAKKIASFFGNKNEPLVVSNACISGLHAQIEAWRLLLAKMARTIIVVAADMLSSFIVSGFQAFRAVSDEPCRPFDEERIGLNLGEASACAIYQRIPQEDLSGSHWSISTGAVFNDSYHMSHPSRTSEGSYRALKAVSANILPDSISMINVHGTATLYNDEMEAVALQRAGLDSVPVNTLKGYVGHTMGAAGLLEAIITMRALDDGIILGTKGFHELGVSKKVNICSQHRPAKGKRFIKLISGFGGCNAAIRFESSEYV